MYSSKKDAPKSATLAMYAATIFLHNWETHIIHAQAKHDSIPRQATDEHPLKDDAEFWFAGFCIPLDDRFYIDENLSDKTRFVLLNQIPFSIVDFSDKKVMNAEKRQDQEAAGHHHRSCMIDSVIFPMVIGKGWTETMRNYSKSKIPHGIFRYPGCRPCGLRQSHISFPWSFILGKPALYSTTKYSRTSWNTLLDEWYEQSHTQKDVEILYYYMIISVLVATYILYQNKKTELIKQLSTGNNNVRQTFPTETLEYLGMDRMYISPPKGAPQFFHQPRHNTADHLSWGTPILNHLKRPLYVECTSKFSLWIPHQEEYDKTWISTDHVDRQYDTIKNRIHPFIKQSDVDLPFFKVNLYILDL